MKRFLALLSVFLMLASQAGAQVNFEPAVRKNIRAQRVNKTRMADEFGAITSNWGAKIAAAHADLDADGGVIDATGIEANLTIASTVTISKPNTHLLIGQGGITASAGTAWFNVTAAGVTVECINSGASGITATIDNDAFVLSSTATGFRLQNCLVKGRNTLSAGFSGVDGNGPTGVYLVNNVFENWGGHCVNTGGSGTATDWHVLHNTFRGCKQNGFLGTGTTSPGFTFSEIVGNTFDDIHANAIDINGGNNRIIGNDVTGTACSNGSGGGSVDVFSILIQSLNSGTIHADDNKIIGNHVHENCGPGIIIRADTGVHTNGTLVSANHSINNSGSGTNGDGVTVDGSSPGTIARTRIIANVLTGNQRKGLQIDGSTATVTDTEAFGNDLTGNTASHIDTGTRTCLAFNKVNTSDAIVRIECAVTMGGSLIPAGGVLMPNNIAIQFNDAGAVARNGLTFNGSDIYVAGAAGYLFNLPGGVSLGTATGGSMGNGTINTQGYGFNGIAGTTGAISCPAGQAVKTITINGGIVTAISCNTP